MALALWISTKSTDCGQPGQGSLQLGRVAAGVAEAVERVRDADQAALLVDRGRRRLGRAPGRHGALQEQADEVAAGRPDLLANDHGERGRLIRRGLRGGQVACPQRAVDALVVGDGQVGQAEAPRVPDQRLERAERVERGGAVAVQVRERAPGAGSET